jgi:hypothetical protein
MAHEEVDRRSIRSGHKMALAAGFCEAVGTVAPEVFTLVAFRSSHCGVFLISTPNVRSIVHHAMAVRRSASDHAIGQQAIDERHPALRRPRTGIQVAFLAWVRAVFACTIRLCGSSARTPLMPPLALAAVCDCHAGTPASERDAGPENLVISPRPGYKPHHRSARHPWRLAAVNRLLRRPVP